MTNHTAGLRPMVLQNNTMKGTRSNESNENVNVSLYVQSSSRGKSSATLVTGLQKVSACVLTSTTLTRPSSPGKNRVTLPRGHLVENA